MSFAWSSIFSSSLRRLSPGGQGDPKDLDCKKAQRVADLVNSSPSLYTLQATAAELKKIPALAPQLQKGIQEFSAQFSSPMPTATGIPAPC
jgi:hypothetical protein